MLGGLCLSLAVVHYKRMEVPESNPTHFNFLPVYSMGLGLCCGGGC